MAGLLSSPRRRRRLAWGAGAASLVGGIVAVGIVWPNTGTSQQLAQHAGVKVSLHVVPRRPIRRRPVSTLWRPPSAAPSRVPSRPAAPSPSSPIRPRRSRRSAASCSTCTPTASRFRCGYCRRMAPRWASRALISCSAGAARPAPGAGSSRPGCPTASASPARARPGASTASTCGRRRRARASSGRPGSHSPPGCSAWASLRVLGTATGGPFAATKHQAQPEDEPVACLRCLAATDATRAALPILVVLARGRAPGAPCGSPPVLTIVVKGAVPR